MSIVSLVRSTAVFVSKIVSLRHHYVGIVSISYRHNTSIPGGPGGSHKSQQTLRRNGLSSPAACLVFEQAGGFWAPFLPSLFLPVPSDPQGHSSVTPPLCLSFLAQETLVLVGVTRCPAFGGAAPAFGCWGPPGKMRFGYCTGIRYKIPLVSYISMAFAESFGCMKYVNL